MKHLDAKVIRERLNAITLAIATLEECSPDSPWRRDIALAARSALREIAELVTDDELEEHGQEPSPLERDHRRRIRAHSRGNANGH